MVILGARSVLAALTERVGAGFETLAFADDETPQALEAISARRPAVVALERVFAATSRGASLITRIKSDPALSAVEIRVVAHDTDYVRVSRRANPPESPAPAMPTQPEAAVAVVAPTQPLDYRGTRRVPRIRVAGTVEVLLDGNPATLVDLSAIGAQVVSPTILRPNQRVRMALPDEVGLVRFNATVAWASFELGHGHAAPRYRAGIEFNDANPQAVEAFGNRHKE